MEIEQQSIICKQKVRPAKSYDFKKNHHGTLTSLTCLVSGKTIKPREIVRETCGRATKTAMFACFCPTKKPLFYFFFKFSHFQSKFRKIKVSKRCQQTQFLLPRSPESMKESIYTLNRGVMDQRTDQKNFVFCSCDDVIKPNGMELRPCIPLCQLFFHSKRFSKLVPPFQSIFPEYISRVYFRSRVYIEILFKNCYHGPMTTFIKGIFNALICYNIFVKCDVIFLKPPSSHIVTNV